MLIKINIRLEKKNNKTTKYTKLKEEQDHLSISQSWTLI